MKPYRPIHSLLTLEIDLDSFHPVRNSWLSSAKKMEFEANESSTQPPRQRPRTMDGERENVTSRGPWTVISSIFIGERNTADVIESDLSTLNGVELPKAGFLLLFHTSVNAQHLHLSSLLKCMQMLLRGFTDHELFRWYTRCSQPRLKYSIKSSVKEKHESKKSNIDYWPSVSVEHWICVVLRRCPANVFARRISRVPKQSGENQYTMKWPFRRAFSEINLSR